MSTFTLKITGRIRPDIITQTPKDRGLREGIEDCHHRPSIPAPLSSILNPRSSIFDPRASGNDDKCVSATDHVGEILVVGHVDAAELLDHLAHFGGGDESVLGM